MFSLRKKSPRRNQVRKNSQSERLSDVNRLAASDAIGSIIIGLLFVALSALILSFELVQRKNYLDMISLTVIVAIITMAAAVYIHHYQKRIIKNHIRALALVSIFIISLAATKMGLLLTSNTSWATGSAVTIAVVLMIAYDQRFAIGMSIFYCVLASFVPSTETDINLLLTMMTGAVVCCYSLKEIRTRMKLLEVGAIAAAAVFVMAMALSFWSKKPQTAKVFYDAGWNAAAAFIGGLLIQSFLPLIEKTFRIATSMTLLDYSDANTPLLKRLAMEAPGTYSHSLLVGSVAEAAADSIGRNGLLCRVGAYYHDIGKINKPEYFIENEIGPTNRHKELSPMMSQLIIIGHVKDGIEMAKEYGLPAVLRQFIETHHGTALVEYFYHEAKKKYDEDLHEPLESEFRHVGPKPWTKEAAIVMLADSVEGAVRSLSEITPPRIETIVHNMAMKRLQDGQFDECDLSLKELSQIEASISKTLAAHYHGRIAYPTPLDTAAAEQN